MNFFQPVSPTRAAAPQALRNLPTRGSMTKEEYRALLAEHGVIPGSADFFRVSGEFMPLEIELGTNVETGEKVVLRAPDQINPHTEIVGASGSGKTDTLRVIVGEVVRSGVPVLVLDLHGDIDVDHVSTAVISSGFGSTVGINPLSIEGVNPDTHSLHNLRVELVATLRRAAPSLSQKQAYILTEALKTAYIAVGIEDRDPRTWNLQPPTFGHVKRVLDHWVSDPEMRGQRESISGCSAVLSAIFGDEVFQRQNVLTTTHLLSGNWRLALNHLPEPTQVIVVDTVLRAIFRRLRAMGTMPGGRAGQPRMFVVLDEAKVIANGQGDRHKGSRILNVIATEGRKFGLGMILASQSREHFGEDVLRSSGTRLVMRTLDHREAQENAKGMQGVSAADLMDLRGNGDGYLLSGALARPVRIQVKPVAR